MYRLEHYLGTRPKRIQALISGQKSPRPLSVKIKLTWQCNLACVMCAQWRIEGKPPPRPQYFDRWSRLETLLESLFQLKTKKVHFSGGEPLSSPFLEQAITWLRDHGQHSSLVSNGTLWTPQRAARLIEAGLSQITFSIDSFHPETFAQMRGRQSWEKLCQGIHNTRHAIAQQTRPIKLRSNTVVTRHNFLELVDYPQRAFELGIQRMRLLPVDDLHSAHALRLNAEQITFYNQHIGPALAESALQLGLIDQIGQAFPFGRSEAEMSHSAQGHYAQGLYERQRCYVPWLHSVVAADGLVYPCCMFKGVKQAIGQLSETQTFEDIWLGKAYQALRQEMLQERAAICAHCDDFSAENRYLEQLHHSAASS